MRYVNLLGSVVFLLASHGPVLAQESEAPRLQRLTIPVDTKLASIDIRSYSLITSDAARDRPAAAEIMQVKADWPRAMQTKSRALFESILARSFTFTAEGQWHERDSYIRDRVESVETVELVRYENLVLQVFGEVAVLTYRNVVSGADGATGLAETWHYSWADIFVSEDGKWKIGGSHLISERSEAP
jgi:hypothetical protein